MTESMTASLTGASNRVRLAGATALTALFDQATKLASVYAPSGFAGLNVPTL